MTQQIWLKRKSRRVSENENIQLDNYLIKNNKYEFSFFETLNLGNNYYWLVWVWDSFK